MCNLSKVTPVRSTQYCCSAELFQTTLIGFLRKDTVLKDNEFYDLMSTLFRTLKMPVDSQYYYALKANDNCVIEVYRTNTINIAKLPADSLIWSGMVNADTISKLFNHDGIIQFFISEDAPIDIINNLIDDISPSLTVEHAEVLSMYS